MYVVRYVRVDCATSINEFFVGQLYASRSMKATEVKDIQEQMNMIVAIASSYIFAHSQLDLPSSTKTSGHDDQFLTQ